MHDGNNDKGAGLKKTQGVRAGAHGFPYTMHPSKTV